MKFVLELKTFFLSETFRSLVTIVLILLIAFDLFQRQTAAREVNANVNRINLSRLMLNSRAQVQLILVKAAIEGRKLNAEDVDTIGRLWASAEYDRAFETSEAK